MFAKQGVDRSPRTLTLWQVRAVCTQREPTGREIIVIVAEREERREEKREEKEIEKEKRKRKRRKREREKEEREREREKAPPSCVGSKRLRVYVQNASVCAGKNARMCSKCFCFFLTENVLELIIDLHL